MDIAQSAPDTVILAEDEASLYLQATQQREWAPQGQTPIMRVDTGRAHTHIYGALNLHTGKEVVMDSRVMTAVATILFLQLVLRTYPDQPILLLWDRGPWHKGQSIKDFLAANPRLQVMFFPPGCPDLNPQEHVWKDARGAVSHNHTFTKLDALLDAFVRHLRTKRFACALLRNMNFDALASFAKALRV